MSEPGDITVSPAGGEPARTPLLVEARSVIIRACRQCGGRREPPPNEHQPCPACGLTDPPVIDDIGLTSARYRDPERQHWWQTAGKALAAARADAANARAQAREGVEP